MSVEQYYQRLSEAIIAGDVEAAVEIVHAGLAAAVEPLDLVNHGIVAAADRLGSMFQCSEIYLPELVMGGKAAKTAMELLIPHLTSSQRESSPSATVVIGTVFGDIHDIGKNLVAALLSARGMQVHNLGVNVPPKAFVAKAEETGANIIGLSALMSTSLYYQRDVIDYLRDSGKRDRYYVIVGGGPATPEWAQEIGADGIGRHATHTVELCTQLLAERPRPPLAQPLVKW
jgi:methylmalonyl-CoA mutase cobalamin-binding domain/chain